MGRVNREKAKLTQGVLFNWLLLEATSLVLLADPPRNCAECTPELFAQGMGDKNIYLLTSGCHWSKLASRVSTLSQPPPNPRGTCSSKEVLGQGQET